MPKTRQQRRAERRRPGKRRRAGSRLFLASMIVLVVGGGAAIYYFRANPPPLTRGAIAGEHWHAQYQIHICGQRMTNYPTVEGEIHSHADGFMHIHPSTQQFSGTGANLGAFLNLYETSIGRLPNGKMTLIFPNGKRYTDGDRCPDKKQHKVVVENKGEPIEGDPILFLMHEGDRITIRFGPEAKDTTDTILNAYAEAKGLPDPGLGTDTPAPG